jgi:hypothetical protein
LQSRQRQLGKFCTTKRTEKQQEKGSISKKATAAKERVHGECVPPAAADIMWSHSATACSRWRCSLLASAKSFSAFFALANADFCDFSAFALAAVAMSKAFREALSSASSDAMRALVDARAPAVQQGKERRSQINSKKKHTGQVKR